MIVEEGKPVAATMMSAVLTCDHRAMDGVAGARWLQAFNDLLQTPALLLD
jgi:pyruvate dehydrogenase E2 component (dihydrolipoamide acetyltransferase)